MMEQSGVLMAFAQIAITLIGFTGIVVVFGNRSKAEWDKNDYQKLMLLILPSLGVFFGSLIPLYIAAADVDIVLNWRISNAAFAVIHILQICWFLVNPIQAKITKGQMLNVPLGIVIIIANISVAFEILLWAETVFLISLTQQLWIGIYNFFLLLAPSLKPDGK